MFTAYPHWVQKLNDTQLDSGSPLQWECKATGKPRPTYRWLKNGAPLLPQVRYVGSSELRPSNLSTMVYSLGFVKRIYYILCGTITWLKNADGLLTEAGLEGGTSGRERGIVGKSQEGDSPETLKS